MERTKQLILRLTQRCNLACRYCYASYGEKSCETQKDMSFETARKAIDLLAKTGDKLKIQFTGGEPLLCLNLIEEIYQYVNQMGIQTYFSLQTNGTLLTTDACILLKKIRCAVGVSLDGMRKANAYRVYPDGREAFEDVITGICKLGALGMYCNINAVVTGGNQAELSQLLELSAYLGNVRGVGLDMFRPLGRGRENDLAPDLEMLGADIERMLQKRAELEKLGVNIRIKELEKVRVMIQKNVREACYCYAQTGHSVAVDPKGDIYPCSSLVGMQKMYMGNVDIGYEFRVEVPGMDGQCADCADAVFCRGGCPAGRVACGGCNEADCLMHRTLIGYGRREYAEILMPD